MVLSVLTGRMFCLNPDVPMFGLAIFRAFRRRRAAQSQFGGANAPEFGEAEFDDQDVGRKELGYHNQEVADQEAEDSEWIHQDPRDQKNYDQPTVDETVSRSLAVWTDTDPSSRSSWRYSSYAGYTGNQSSYATFKSSMIETTALSLPLDQATAFFNFSMFALIIGAMITIAATIGVIWASALKSRYTDEHLAHALTQREQAKADAARANERAAELLLRAQQARLEQEKAHIELEQVRSIAGPRRISGDQCAKIVKALRGHSMMVNLLRSSNDAEAKQFADDIAKALRDAGLTVNSATSLLPIPVRGLGMTMSSSETATVLYAALRGAGLEIQDLPERNPVMIVIGAKPSAAQ